MNTIRNCGCKGIRTCLECELNYEIERPALHDQLKLLNAYAYCMQCQCFYAGWQTDEVQAQHPAHENTKSLYLPGIFVQQNFLNAADAAQVMQCLDDMPWSTSQSGRRKQNFGPKTNFKRRKLQNGQFHGFPQGTRFIQKRFANIDLLRDFRTIEQCSLEYDPSKGASIDAHIDDCWIWGERVVTVNCLGDAVLSMTLYESKATNDAKLTCKYNLDLVTEYEKQLLLPLVEPSVLQQYKGCVFRIPMPSQSLIVLYGPARYQFEHAVLREDINERRVCIAYREFTQTYLSGKNPVACELANPILANAQCFWQQ